MQNRGMVVMFVLIVAALGCNGATDVDGSLEAGQTTEPLILVSESVVSEPADGAVRVEVHVRVRNQLQDHLIFNECDVSIERADGSEWRGVWMRICDLGRQGHPNTRLAPGEEADFTLHVDGALGRAELEKWTPPIQGEYRIRIFSLLTDGGPVSSERQTSATFRLPD